MSDAPTQRLGTTGGRPDPAPDRRNRALLVTLLVIGGLLLIGIVILLLLLLLGGGKPVASATTSPTATAATPSATPTVPSPAPSATATRTAGGGGNGGSGASGGDNGSVTIASYSISPTQVDCSGGKTEVPLTIRWVSRNGVHAYFGVDAGSDPQHPGDAKTNGMGWVLPPSGSNADFPAGYRDYAFPCASTSQRYTITVEGASGTQSRLIEVTRKP